LKTSLARHQELECRVADDDDELGRTRHVLVAQKGGEDALEGRARERGPIERLGEELDAALGRGCQYFAQAAVDLEVRRQEASVGVQDEDVPDLRRHGRRESAAGGRDAEAPQKHRQQRVRHVPAFPLACAGV